MALIPVRKVVSAATIPRDLVVTPRGLRLRAKPSRAMIAIVRAMLPTTRCKKSNCSLPGNRTASAQYPGNNEIIGIARMVPESVATIKLTTTRVYSRIETTSSRIRDALGRILGGALPSRRRWLLSVPTVVLVSP